MGHPSMMTEKDINELAVPIQILAPETDAAFTAELKTHSFETIQKLGLPFDYQHFPGVVHSCFIRGDQHKPGERGAMERGGNAVVSWFNQFLHAA
jgi:dienelactone hydrolase